MCWLPLTGAFIAGIAFVVLAILAGVVFVMVISR